MHVLKKLFGAKVASIGSSQRYLIKFNWNTLSLNWGTAIFISLHPVLLLDVGLHLPALLPPPTPSSARPLHPARPGIYRGRVTAHPRLSRPSHRPRITLHHCLHTTTLVHFISTQHIAIFTSVIFHAKRLNTIHIRTYFEVVA